MTVDEIIATFATIHDRAALVAFLTPVRLPTDLPEHDRTRLTSALVAVASRCWRARICG
jgi:hypothetical protein